MAHGHQWIVYIIDIIETGFQINIYSISIRKTQLSSDQHNFGGIRNWNLSQLSL